VPAFDLKEHPEVERAIELNNTALYLLTVKPTTPRRVVESLGSYLKSLGVNAIVLALDDVHVYDVERKKPHVWEEVGHQLDQCANCKVFRNEETDDTACVA
jgi:hypothetical protein